MPAADAPDAGEAMRCGYVAILGAPNAGKSTLTNRLVGSKVSIVSPKVQTTRTRILGILVEGPSQMVLVDTPGIFRPKRRLERAMVRAAWEGLPDADLVVLLVDAGRGCDPDTLGIVAGLREAGRKAVLALNKIDAIRRERLLELAARLDGEGVFDAVFMISALDGNGVDDLKAHLLARLPAGPWLFPADQVADMAERFLAAEIVREQVFLQLHDELPYDIAVETEAWQERKDGSAKVDVTVYVRRESQRGIVLGHGGRQLRRIGERARAELTQLLARPVHLFLFVKVRENWQDERERYRAMGLEFDS